MRLIVIPEPEFSEIDAEVWSKDLQPFLDSSSEWMRFVLIETTAGMVLGLLWKETDHYSAIWPLLKRFWSAVQYDYLVQLGAGEISPRDSSWERIAVFDSKSFRKVFWVDISEEETPWYHDELLLEIVAAVEKFRAEFHGDVWSTTK